MSLLIFDPFAGIAGDMTVAALLDLGLEEAWLRELVNDIAIPGVDVKIERVDRRGIRAPHIVFEYEADRGHRHLKHVIEIIDRANVDDRARQLAKDAFHRLATAEARVHGTTIEKVHFHEVGAVDAILDIVCSMAGIVELGFTSFATRPVAVGSGSIEIEHGRYPVPAPATLEILGGIPITGTDLEGECATPTGAAILATLTAGARPPARFVPVRSGFGAGTRNPERGPNVLRLIAARVEPPSTGQLWLLQADIDDLAPEYAAAAQQALLAAGALDVVLVQTGMKKGRPGMRIEALTEADRLEVVEQTMFRATTTIGVRRWPVERTALERRIEVIEWRGQRIRLKRISLPDGTSRAKPEYDDVVAAAATLGLTALEVRTALDAEAAGRAGQ